MVSFFWAKIWHRLIPYTCLQNLSPREHSLRDRELASTLNREREREKFSKRRLRIPPTWFTPLTPVDFQRVTGLTRESRPNTGRLTKFRVNTMMHRLIHPNCAQNTRRARRAIPTARLRKRRKCATGLKPRYTPINSPCTMTNISWISCSKAVTYFLLYETRLSMTDINY